MDMAQIVVLVVFTEIHPDVAIAIHVVNPARRHASGNALAEHQIHKDTSAPWVFVFEYLDFLCSHLILLSAGLGGGWSFFVIPVFLFLWIRFDQVDSRLSNQTGLPFCKDISAGICEHQPPSCKLFCLKHEIARQALFESSEPSFALSLFCFPPFIHLLCACRSSALNQIYDTNAHLSTPF